MPDAEELSDDSEAAAEILKKRLSEMWTMVLHLVTTKAITFLSVAAVRVIAPLVAAAIMPAPSPNMSYSLNSLKGIIQGIE